MDSEKYQYRPRDWEAAARDGVGIADYITELNRIRRAHPALHRLRNLRFHHVDQPELMCFSKRDHYRWRAGDRYRTGGRQPRPTPDQRSNGLA